MKYFHFVLKLFLSYIFISKSFEQTWYTNTNLSVDLFTILNSKIR